MLVCPSCNETVHVGFGGEKNLETHRTSKACKRKSQNKSKGPRLRPNQDLHAFFKPRVPLNPPTVTAPPPIHADEKATDILDEISRGMVPGPSASCDHLEVGAEITETETGNGMGTSLPSLKVGKSPCPHGIELLNRLEAATMRIPADIPLATTAHRLSGFSADPRTCVASPDEDEDDWAILNAMLKASFGWGEAEMRDSAKTMLNRGEHGLDGFIRFFKFFVLERGLEGVMIETKVDELLHELDSR
jgi:hypothetical protein